MPTPTINRKKCNLCGTCVEVCPNSVLQKKPTRIEVIKQESCIGCRACEAQCETSAVVIVE
ncbi:MAG: 4Fe-4S binding protein [Candidatus Woesearchaeota archaeon]